MLQRGLVVGYGSIGARHARLLTELGCHTAVVSRRKVDFSLTYSDLGSAIAAENPDYIVIANETCEHRQTLVMLGQLGYEGTVLVEKPLFTDWIEFPTLPFHNTYVAYNLRFHPVIQRLKTVLKGEQILSVQAYVGQYLPDWRPNSDYRESYSASAERGGGVLRDLSHELDYLTWIFGNWERVTALGGHLSTLEINSDDVFALMLVAPDCPVVMLQLNYLDRMARRTLLINTARHTIEADLIKGAITIDRDCESISVGRDDTYRAMHQAILAGDAANLCTFEEGLETLRLIGAAEQAARLKEWVMR